MVMDDEESSLPHPTRKIPGPYPTVFVTLYGLKNSLIQQKKRIMDPAQFETAATISLVLAGLCCLIIVADLLTGHPQKMGVMNIVWPVTAL